MSLTFASEISDLIAIRRRRLLERGERALGIVGKRRRLEVDRERQHLRSHLAAEGRRLLQELLIASSLLLEQALERARWGRRTNLGHWFDLSNKVWCRKRQKFISKMEGWSFCATSTSWRWCCGWAASSWPARSWRRRFSASCRPGTSRGPRARWPGVRRGPPSADVAVVRDGGGDVHHLDAASPARRAAAQYGVASESWA